MDAYCDYIMRMADDRVTRLRREAETDRLARVARARRGSRVQVLLRSIRRRRSPGVAAPPVRLPTPSTAETELRRSA